MSKKTIDAGERYRELLGNRKKSEPTYKKMSPSGMEWELRRVNAQAFILSGKLPLAIAEKVSAAMSSGEASEAAFGTLTQAEQTQAVKFMQFLVTKAVVSPRIVQEVTGPDEIDEILEEDFAFLLAEAMGGGRAEALGKFRRK